MAKKDNIFERAARKKLRFQTSRGDIAAENLFDIPLTSSDGFNLDEIAQATAKRLEGHTAHSFVKVDPKPAAVDEALRLDVLKRVIEIKMEDQAAALTRAKNAERRRQLLNVLAAKDTEEMAQMDRDEILEELEKLSA